VSPYFQAGKPLRNFYVYLLGEGQVSEKKNSRKLCSKIEDRIHREAKKFFHGSFHTRCNRVKGNIGFDAGDIWVCFPGKPRKSPVSGGITTLRTQTL